MSRAVESYQLVQAGTTGTTMGAAIPVDGATLGTVQVDDGGSGTFVVEVKARIDSTAEWQVLQVILQDNTRATTITAEGLYDIWVFCKADIQISITDNTGATSVSIWLGLNS